jgi:hypothetical protein
MLSECGVSNAAPADTLTRRLLNLLTALSLLLCVAATALRFRAGAGVGEHVPVTGYL